MFAAGDGGIEPTGLFARRVAGELPAGCRTDGARIHDNRARAHRFEHASFAQHHFFNRGRVTDNDDDHIGLSRGIGRACGNLCPGLFQGLGFGTRAIESRNFEARLQQVQSHRFAHQTETDETDGLRHEISSRGLRRSDP